MKIESPLISHFVRFLFVHAKFGIGKQHTHCYSLHIKHLQENDKDYPDDFTVSLGEQS